MPVKWAVWGAWNRCGNRFVRGGIFFVAKGGFGSFGYLGPFQPYTCNCQLTLPPAWVKPSKETKKPKQLTRACLASSRPLLDLAVLRQADSPLQSGR